MHKIIAIFPFLLLACTSNQNDYSGTYRGIIDSPGGEIGFPLVIERNQNGYNGFVVNSTDTLYFDNIEIDNDSLVLNFSFYDVYSKVAKDENGDLNGRWFRKDRYEKANRLPFRAQKDVLYRYEPTAASHTKFDGDWNASFGGLGAEGIMSSTEDGKLYATFVSQLGDFRFMEGVYDDSSFVLSTYDGAHAYLMKGDLLENGSLSGFLWSKDDTKLPFTATKGSFELSDPLLISAKNVVGKKAYFSFPDVNGNMVSSEDERFKDKALVIYIFGSWCPNCADQAELLREYYEDYRDKNIEFVGLAFEFTGNIERDTEMIKRYQKRWDAPWTLLLAGKAEKDEAADVLPFLDKVLSFPSTIFTDSTQTIKNIHVGFNGPATGTYYINERNRFKLALDDISSTQ